ncbi:MAG: hypothetical protein ACRENL_01740 [Candidatus Dormibacteria bacterium]
MAYDSYRQQVVLFGGSAGGGTLDDTWILHGRTWSTRHPPSHPGALAVELMAYDARTHTCLLVGSATIQGPAQTWSWDGTTWTRLSDLPLEGVEGPQTLAFDPATGHALLLSAMPSDAGIGSHRTRAWTWDGRSWTLGAAPPSFADTAGEARLATVGVGSSSRNGRGVLALFEDAIGTHETWFWDGVTWSKRAAGGTPLYDPELSSTLAEDTTTGDVVLIGLARSDGRSAQTWLWDGTSWRQGVAAPLAASAYHGTLVLSDAASGHAIVIGESTSGNLVNLFDVLWTFDGNSWVSDRGA